MKIVLDTNILLSGLLTRGVCEALLDICMTTGRFTVALSEYILVEFTHHAEKKFGISPSKVNSTVKFLRNHFELVEPVDIPSGTCRDVNDLPILGTAVAAKAEYLVTGDHDLLQMISYEGFSIVTPRAFYELID